MTAGWTACAKAERRSIAKNVEKRPSRRKPGTFRIENLQEGLWGVRLRLEGGMPQGSSFRAVPSDKVEVKEGKVTKVAYHYQGPGLRSRLRIDLDVGRIKHIYPQGGTVTLSGPGGVQTVGEDDSAVYGHTFDDLLDGEFTLRVNDPRFRPVIAPVNTDDPDLVRLG